VAQRDAVRLEVVAVRERLQPLHVLGLQAAGVQVERVACGLVVVRVVHPARDGGVVVAEDGDLGLVADDVRALVGAGAVTHDVTETVELVDALLTVCFHDRREGLDVRVYVAENA